MALAIGSFQEELLYLGTMDTALKRPHTCGEAPLSTRGGCWQGGRGVGRGQQELSKYQDAAVFTLKIKNSGLIIKNSHLAP